MPDEINQKIDQLTARLEAMVKYQEYFYREINLIRQEISALKEYSAKAAVSNAPIRETISENDPPAAAAGSGQAFSERNAPPANRYQAPPVNPSRPAPPGSPPPEMPFSMAERQKSGLEEFVGKNIISLIGIIITILGVGIGTKYAIDRDLISPLMRIVLGYAFGFGLLAVAVRLKAKYLNFSAVLLSGAMAAMYFITYFAYGFYELMSQSSAFVLMLIFTVFTVAAALNYNRQIIAHIGLVGAYAVPFLLSNNSGQVAVLFGYMAIINIGILAISVKRYWKYLFYTSFAFTWLIYAGWHLTAYRPAEHFALALGFLGIFFLIFYATFIAYKVRFEEAFGYENVILLLLNSFIFYGFGCSVIDDGENSRRYLGLFTLANAALHFAVAMLTAKFTRADRSVVNFLKGLTWVFITIAVPVQFKGHWITLLWTAEVVFLFRFGRTKNLPLYEYFAYPLMLLASVSLINDWQTPPIYESDSAALLTPILNARFLTSILFAGAFGYLSFLNRSAKYQTAVSKDLAKIAGYAIPAIFLAALYNTFRLEIAHYYDYQTFKTAVPMMTPDGTPILSSPDLESFNAVWQLNYTMFFLAALSFVNLRRVKSRSLGFVNLGLNVFLLIIFLSAGLFLLGELRESYLVQTAADAFTHGVFNIGIRYISLGFVAALLLSIYYHFKAEFLRERFSPINLERAFDLIFYGSLLWLAGSELLNLTDIFSIAQGDRLGLSILYGVYALMMIGLGIYKRKTHLRIGAIILFALTLVKLFFYDIAGLDTISKTIVFVTLGILLLVISFLYNKYKYLIFDEETDRGSKG